MAMPKRDRPPLPDGYITRAMLDPITVESIAALEPMLAALDRGGDPTHAL